MSVYANAFYQAVVGPFGVAFGVSHAAPVAIVAIVATVLAGVLLLSQLAIAALRTPFGRLIGLPLPPFKNEEIGFTPSLRPMSKSLEQDVSPLPGNSQPSNGKTG